MSEQLQKADQRLSDMASIAEAMAISRSGSGGGVTRIEDIPGRRIPFTWLVQIPIGADDTSVQQGTLTISQEGPFVATRRMATFMSALEFQALNEETGQTSRLAGRSFGRFRPIHSANDLLDSQHAAQADSTAFFLAASAGAAAGTVLPTGALSLPSNTSSFRTMEFDGMVSIVNAGSSYPRQNIPVPTSMWANGLGDSVELGALDFFERGEIITINVQPNHVNNPPAGNVDGQCIFPQAATGGIIGYPFLDSQYDMHEGICSPNGVLAGGDSTNDWEPATEESVIRVPNGVLIIGFEGYRIHQPIAPAI